jgi:hypothetical protein
MAKSSIDPSQYRFRAVEEACFSFLAAVSSMCRGERPLDVDHLLRLADMVLEVQDQCLQRTEAQYA